MLSDLSDDRSRIVGLKQLMKNLRANRVKKVYLAMDADGAVTAPVRALCGECGVPVEESTSMKELGRACRIQVGAAAAGVLKEEAR